MELSCLLDELVDCRGMWPTDRSRLGLSKGITIMLLFFCFTGTKLFSNRMQEVSVVKLKE